MAEKPQNEDPATNTLTSPPPDVSRTYLGDWTWMLKIPDNAFRVYLCCRAFIFEKDPGSIAVQLTDAEIGKLIGKSEDSAARGRKECYKHGLLWEVARSTESRPPKKTGGKPRVRTVRTLGVAQEPPAGFTGPTNCYAELRRIRDDAEQQTPESVFAGHCKGADLPPHSDQGVHDRAHKEATDPGRPDQGKQQSKDVFAGHCEGANLPEARADLPEARADLLRSAPDDQGKRTSQVSFQVPLQPTRGSGDDGESLGGWLEEQSNEEQRARSLLDRLVMPHGPTYEPQKTEIAHVAAALEAEASEDAISDAILNGIAGAEKPAATVKGRCAGLWKIHPDRGREGSSHRRVELEWPEWCGSCDEYERTHYDAEQEIATLCRSCHPTIVGWVERVPA